MAVAAGSKGRMHFNALLLRRGAEVILITDRWVSPAAVHARHTLVAHIEAPSAWDSMVSITVLVETLLA